MEEWKVELFLTSLTNAMDDREAFRDRDDDDYSESIRDGLRRWRRVAGAQYEAALAAAAASGDRARADADADAEAPLPAHNSEPSIYTAWHDGSQKRSWCAMGWCRETCPT